MPSCGGILWLCGAGDQRGRGKPFQFRGGKGCYPAKQRAANVSGGLGRHPRGKKPRKSGADYNCQRYQQHDGPGLIDVRHIAFYNPEIDDIRHVAGKRQFAHRLSE